MKCLNYIWLFIAVITCNVLVSCKSAVQEKTKEEWLNKHLSKIEDISDIGESEKSHEEAKQKMKDNLALKVANLIDNYLLRVQIASDDEIGRLIRNQLKDYLYNHRDNLENLAEFREKYYDKPNHKFYALGAINTEKLIDFLTSDLSGFYNTEAIYHQLKEQPGGIYRVRVNSRYADNIVSILAQNGFTFDNSQWFVEIVGQSEKVDETSIASLSGPLYTIKAQYVISIKGKNGTLIGQLTSNIGKGVSNSKSRAFNKAIANTSIDVGKIAQFTSAMKENIDNYVHEMVEKRIEKSAISDWGSLQRMIQNKDYSLAESNLERASISSREFPQAIGVYLKVQAHREREEKIAVAEEKSSREKEEHEAKWVGELILKFILKLLGL